MNGILLVDKPRGPTSHDMVHLIRKLAGGEKVGHTGTLDPAACGLLIVCIGRMTRTARLFVDLEKEYTGTILFGRQSDTLDLEGKTVRRTRVPETVISSAASWARSHRGIVLQKAPRYSARKWKGKALHRYAREGTETPVSEKNVEISRVQISRGRTMRRGDFRIVVSSGFFVRSWIRDLGSGIGVATTLGYLRRERVGPFTVDRAISLDGLTTRDQLADHMISGGSALSWIPTLDLHDTERQRLQQGGFVEFSHGGSFESSDIVKIMDGEEILLLARVHHHMIRPWIVLKPWNSN